MYQFIINKDLIPFKGTKTLPSTQYLPTYRNHLYDSISRNPLLKPIANAMFPLYTYEYFIVTAEKTRKSKKYLYWEQN